MHIYFSGIGGTAIGPLALIARQAGYDVSGSDKQDSQYISYLRKQGINIHITQDYESIESVHRNRPIDWFVYSSAVSIENPDAPELKFCSENNIKTSKRDDLLNKIIADKNLKLIAVAGTHGKTTVTAMTVWLFQQLEIPITHSVGAKISYGEMGHYDEKSEYFILEADEFDRNFLAFHPYMSLITGVDWDHQEIFRTLEDYQQAFRDFTHQSKQNIAWQDDVNRLALPTSKNLLVAQTDDPNLSQIKLLGDVNRRNAWLVICAVHELTKRPVAELIEHMNRFPGVNRRFERISERLYSDYAHTVEKIRGCLQTASEASKNVVVVYEPLTNRRQYFIREDYKNLFKDIKKLYWVPSYLAREDPNQPVLTPAELITNMDNPEIAEPAELNESLKRQIQDHIKDGDLVVCMSGGGGSSLDEWLRKEFAE